MDKLNTNNLVTQADCTPQEEKLCPVCNELMEPHADHSDGETLQPEWICINEKCERYGRI